MKLIICLLSILIFSLNVFAQVSERDSIKLAKLSDNVARLQEKLERYEYKYFQADSAIDANRAIIESIRMEWFQLENQNELFEKESKSKLKSLKKQAKVKDGEQKEQAVKELEKFEKQNEKDINNYYKHIETLRKQAIKADNYMRKNEDKKLLLEPKLNEVRSDLQQARENYQNYLNN